MGQMTNEELMRKIQQEGTIFDVTEQRSLLLKSGMGFPVDKEAEWVVITGCYNLLLFTPVYTFGKLLKAFGVDYTFLAKEYCCGHPLVTEADKQGKSVEEMRAIGKCGNDGMRKNRDVAIKLNAKGIVTICPGCLCMSQEYAAGDGMGYVFILDFISRYFQGGKLSLAFDLYEGCHKYHSHFPSFDLDLHGAKNLLNKFQGLSINEVPSLLCCLRKPESVFARCKTKQLVTPTPCCYYFLNNARPKDGVQVTYFGEILCRSLGI